MLTQFTPQHRVGLQPTRACGRAHLVGPFHGALADRYSDKDEAQVILGARGAIIYV